jgi:hypothetical protein
VSADTSAMSPTRYREFGHVGGEVAVRARASGGLVEAPKRVGGGAPFLQAAPAEVVDLGQLARLDEMGERAVELLMARRAGRGELGLTLLAPRLVVRESSKRFD